MRHPFSTRVSVRYSTFTLTFKLTLLCSQAWLGDIKKRMNGWWEGTLVWVMRSSCDTYQSFLDGHSHLKAVWYATLISATTMQHSPQAAAAAVKAPPPPARCWSAEWLCFSSPSLSAAGWFYIAFHCASVLLVKSRCSALEWGQSHPHTLCCNNYFFLINELPLQTNGVHVFHANILGPDCISIEFKLDINWIDWNCLSLKLPCIQLSPS